MKGRPPYPVHAGKTRRLKSRGFDRKAYHRFIQGEKDKLRKMGFDEKEAYDLARKIGAMYRHHFRIWK